MEIRKVSVMGLGAVGCTVVPKLLKVMPKEDVRIIAGGSRKERLEKNGIEVNGEHYDLYVTAPEEEVEPADLLIVAVKYSGLKQAVQDIRKHVGEHTTILSLMNGVNSRQIIGEEYGIEKCIYGICNVSTVNLGGGKFSVQEAPKGIMLGEAENKAPYSERVAAISDLFTKAGVGFWIPENMVHESWWKFLLNVGGNCTNTVLRGTQSYFQVLAPANEARRLVMEEVLAVAQAEGAPVTQADVDELMGVYVNYPGGNTCSMMQDLMAHRQTENDMFCGYVIELGKKHGIPTPVNEFLYCLLDSLNQVNAGADVSIVDPMLKRD